MTSCARGSLSRHPPVARGAPSIIGLMTTPATVAVVADDLIWAGRLTDAVRRAGAEPRRLAARVVVDADRIAHAGDAIVADTSVAGVIVDSALMTADPLAVIAALTTAGIPVLVVADHDDVAFRKRALAAGAGRVLAYRKLYEDGPRVVAAWLGLPEPAAGPDPHAVPSQPR